MSDTAIRSEGRGPAHHIGGIFRAASWEFVHGAHLTAITIAGQLLTWLLLFRLPIQGSILAIAYLIPLIVYNIDHLRGLRNDAAANPERATHLSKSIRLRWALVILYCVMLVAIALLYTPLRVQLVTVALLGAGLAYPKRLTAQIPAFKSFYVALSITSVVFLAMVWFQPSLSVAMAVVWLCLFTRVLISAVYSDVKDIEADAAAGLKTIPVLLGERGTRVLLTALSVLSFVPLVVAVGLGMAPRLSLLLLVFLVPSVYFLAISKGRHTAVGFALETEFLLWPVIILIGSWLASGI